MQLSIVVVDDDDNDGADRERPIGSLSEGRNGFPDRSLSGWGISRRNRRRIPSVNTGTLHRVYRLAAIFREADYSGQILNAERKCLPTVSCSETNMCDPAVSKAVSREFDGRKRCL